MSTKTTASTATFRHRVATPVALAVLAVGVVASIASSEEEPALVEEGGEGDGGESAGGGDAPEEFGIGDVVELGDWQVQVHGITDPHEESNEFMQPEEGNRFVAVDVEVTNNSDSPQTVSSLACFEIQDDQSISYEQTVGSETAQAPDGEVAANGGTRRGTILYEVPGDAGGLVLNFACDLLSSGTATIRLS